MACRVGTTRMFTWRSRVSRIPVPSSGPLLVEDEIVRSPEEDFARPVLPEFAAKRTLNGDGLEGEFPDAGWNVATASLACHHEGLAG